MRGGHPSASASEAALDWPDLTFPGIAEEPLGADLEWPDLAGIIEHTAARSNLLDDVQLDARRLRRYQH